MRVYCDLDGTLIRGDLEREFVGYFQSTGSFTIRNYLLALISIPANKLRRKQERGSIYKSWTVGFTAEKKDRLFSDFLENETGKLETRADVLGLLEEYKSRGSEIILMTGSYRELVLAFLKKKNMVNVFDEVIACEVKGNGFCVSQHPYGKDKCLFLKKDMQLIGIANEYADRFYLEQCSVAYVVGKDEKLKRIADEKKWRCL